MKIAKSALLSIVVSLFFLFFIAQFNTLSAAACAYSWSLSKCDGTCSWGECKIDTVYHCSCMANATNTPTATKTNTPKPPTATNTPTPKPPTATKTNTPKPPTATNTPKPPTATNTPTPKTCSAAFTSNCSQYKCGAGTSCVSYMGYCQCLSATNTPTGTPAATATPQTCSAAFTSNCGNYKCGAGTSCVSYMGYCQCMAPTNTPTNTPTRTPTRTPTNTPTTASCKAHGVLCTANSQCCSNVCSYGYCYGPFSTNTPTKTPTNTQRAATNTSTKTPTRTPTLAPCENIAGQSCLAYATICTAYGQCAGVGYCSSGSCCKSCVSPTLTPTRTPTVPGPTTGASCSPEDKVQCVSSTTASECRMTATNVLQWSPPYPCNYYCYDNVNNMLSTSVKCATSNRYAITEDTLGRCCPQTGIPYCHTFCDKLNVKTGLNCQLVTVGTKQYQYVASYCWASYEAYLADVKIDKTPNKDLITSATCEYVDACINCAEPPCDECTVFTWSCGGPAVCTPPQVPNVDNCANEYCGPTCGPVSPTLDTTKFPATDTPTHTPTSAPQLGTLRARAVIVDDTDVSCAALTNSTTGFEGATLRFNPAVVPANQTQPATATYLEWTDVTTNGSTNYTVLVNPNTETYIQANACVSRNFGAWTQTSSGSLSDGGTLRYIVGFIPQAGWVRTVNGNVYAQNTVSSSIPSALSTYFSMTSTTYGDAGIVSYGSSYDFSRGTGLGAANVSEPGWLIPHTNASANFYQEFAERMDVPGSATALTAPATTNPTCAAGTTCIYYVNGDMTTESTDWSIGATEKMVIFVNGNVTINGRIQIANGGFFSIIASGDITVSTTLGVPVTAPNPGNTNLEGIFITNGTFSTSNSTGNNRLIVLGSVIANSFQLLRDAGAAYNDTYPSEVFRFDPQLLFTMPDEMKDIPYTWQELAP